MFDNRNNKKNKDNIGTILSIGVSVQFTLALSLTEKQCKDYHTLKQYILIK